MKAQRRLDIAGAGPITILVCFCTRNSSCAFHTILFKSLRVTWAFSPWPTSPLAGTNQYAMSIPLVGPGKHRLRPPSRLHIRTPSTRGYRFW